MVPLGEVFVTIGSPERSAHGFVVHIRLVFVLAPQLGDSLGVHQLKNALFSLCPFDVFGTGVFVLQQGQEELPQVDSITYKNKGLLYSSVDSLKV